MFATRTAGQIRVQYDWTFNSYASVKVDEYKNPVGYTFTVTNSDTQGHMAPDGYSSQIPQRLVCTHGIFWKSNSPNVERAYVTQQTTQYGNIVNMADYLAPPANPDPSKSAIWPLYPGESHYWEHASAGSFALRFELQVDVSVSLDAIGAPVSFGTKLQSTLIEGSIGGSRAMRITATNVDTVMHKVMWYVEGDDVLHFWQIT
jgi:hypothetical protein